MSKGFYRHRTLAVVLVFMILAVSLTRLPQTNAKFVIAGWDHPDEYGQGIFAVTVYQYIDAFWWSLANFYWTNTTSETTVMINHTGPVQIQMRSWINNSVVGADNITDGQNYLQHYAEISLGGVGVVYSKQNATWNYQNDYSGMFQYYYNMTFSGFSPQAGHFYTVVLIYEVWM